jgi:hypothetical protein
VMRIDWNNCLMMLSKVGFIWFYMVLYGFMLIPRKCDQTGTSRSETPWRWLERRCTTCISSGWIMSLCDVSRSIFMTARLIIWFMAMSQSPQIIRNCHEKTHCYNHHNE